MSVRNGGNVDHNDLPTFLPENIKAENFSMVSEKCKIVNNLINEGVEN